MSRSVIFALLVLFLVLAGAFAADPIEELAESLVEALVTPAKTSRPRTTRPRPKSTRPRTTRPSTRRPRPASSSRPKSTRPRTTRPSTRRPRTTRPSTRRPAASQRPKSRRPASQKPKSQKPKTSSRKPTKSQKPASQKPKSQRPKSQKPASQKPKSNKPSSSQKPKSQKPKSQTPKSSKPATSAAPKSSKPTSTSAPKPSTPQTGNSAEKSLKQIFGHEGKCQNWKGDSGNKFQGSIGYTCNGIIPSVGYNNRNGAFNYAAEKCKNAGANFVKCAYDADPAKFKEGAAQVYREQYFKPAGCTGLKMPAYYLCADIAVNSGVGRAKQYLREIGNVSDPKELARKLNERHRADYIKWSSKGPNAAFRKGWLARADGRAKYISNYQGDD